MPDANRLEEYKKIIIPVLKDNDVEKAGLFGSFARGNTGKDSDIDILIRFKGRKTLFDLVGVKQELEEKTKRKVDLITYNSLHPLLKDRILKEEVELYEER